MNMKCILPSSCVVFVLACVAQAQSPRVLYTWNGVGNTQGWNQKFGDNTVTLENLVDGELTVTETGGAGATVAIGDLDNPIVEGAVDIGGLDITGLSSIEVEMGHNGTDPVDVQFYVQATPAYEFVALGPDQPVTPGTATYSAPLDSLTPAQIAYIRIVGINIRDHAPQGDLVWTIKEVRSSGTPLKTRDFATHEGGTSEDGFQGAFVNFENASVEGNDGGQNHTGLRINLAEPPAGNTGSLQWTDLAAGAGGAITWVNGTVNNGNSFNQRPTDMSNYAKIVIRMAATNTNGGVAESVGVQYFLQTYAYNFFGVAGAIQNLPADGEYHDLTFDISSLQRLDFVDTHGVNLQPHAGGDLIIDVDYVRAMAAVTITDCNRNGIDDARDLIDGTSKDCNENQSPDECDISTGASQDCNSNKIPDECDIKGGPVTRVLYTWAGTDDVRGWFKPDGFGTNEVILENSTSGELTVTEIGTEGTNWAINDNFTQVAEDGSTAGGLDLTGMSSIEVEVGHSGTGPVNAQFFVQATPGFVYVALGPDVPVVPEVSTYTLPLDSLTPEQITFILSIGLNVRDHIDQGNLIWTLREVRVVGVPLTQRDYATHEPGTSDGGRQGAIVAADNAAVLGNDGSQNQTGLSQNTSAPPAGNTGSLQWTDVAGQNGGAVAWFNGTVFGGNTFGERPTDMSNYTEIRVRLSARNVTPGAVESVDLFYFLETGGFNHQTAGPAQLLPADGAYYDLTFPIGDIAERRYTDAHGLDLQEHADGDLIIDVDGVRAVSRSPTPADCNVNGFPDSCDIAGGRSDDLNGNGFPDECEPAGPVFHRADADGNGELQLTDAVRILNVLFLGTGVLNCLDAADADDNGVVQLTDAVRILNVLFLGTGTIPSPGPPAEPCGLDSGGELGCETYNCQ